MGRRLLPAVRDCTRDGRWSTYDVSVLKMGNVSFREKCARMGNTLKIPSPTKLARLGHFPPASQAGRLDGPVFLLHIFFSKHGAIHPEYLCVQAGDHMAAPTVEQVIRTNR